MKGRRQEEGKEEGKAEIGKEKNKPGEMCDFKANNALEIETRWVYTLAAFKHEIMFAH